MIRNTDRLKPMAELQTRVVWIDMNPLIFLYVITIIMFTINRILFSRTRVSGVWREWRGELG